MKRFTSLVRKRSGQIQGQGPIDPNASPEENAARGVRLFCESGSQNSNDGEGQEYLHLPAIVDAAESSPAAAKSAAYQIRKLIKDSYAKPYIQYNAIMLIRILADNPGPSFTQNVDEKFIITLRTLLQQGRDPSVRQILIETLHALETEKSYDQNLVPLTAMWLKERTMMNTGPRSQFTTAQGAIMRSIQQPKSRKTLPPPAELAGRIEEARTSAQLLTQLTQSTPSSQVLSNDLMGEFAQRCQSAQHTLQSYMNCTDPAPDEATFQTLIEVSEQLNIAMSKHQRAILAARKEFGQTASAERTMSPPQAGALPPAPPLNSHPMMKQQQPAVATQPGGPTAAPRNTNPFLTSARSPPATSTNGVAQPATTQPSARNPFSDENEIPSRTAPSNQAPILQSNSQAAAQGTTEIGATLAGPAPHSSQPVSHIALDDMVFDAPPGPPPKKSLTDPMGLKSAQPAATGFAQPTNASSSPPAANNWAYTNAPTGNLTRPLTQESDDEDLYGTSAGPSSTQHDISPLGEATGPFPASVSTAQSPSSNVSSAGGRILDDEPMTPGVWSSKQY